MCFCRDLLRLKRYFQMYWLKPFDALNDAANAAALLKLDWGRGPLLEVGGGDGVFSFIMHGGAFKFLDDRYDQADTTRQGDIYDVYREGRRLGVNRNASMQYDLGLDLKLSHLFKAQETGMYKGLVSSLPEALPVKDNYFGTVFLYTFHGLTDYEKTLKEIRRAIRPDGRLLMVAVNSLVRKSFLCHKLYLYFKRMGLNDLSRYFLMLDGGREAEIAGLFSKDIEEWISLFKNTGFSIGKAYSHTSSLLWKIYDTQTRPILKILIAFNHRLKKLRIKFIFKALWLVLWFPVILFAYLLFSRQRVMKAEKLRCGVFFVFELKPI